MQQHNNTMSVEQPMKKPRTDDDLDLGDLDDEVMEDGPISQSAAVEAVLTSEIQLKLVLEEMVNQTERSTPTKRMIICSIWVRVLTMLCLF